MVAGHAYALARCVEFSMLTALARGAFQHLVDVVVACIAVGARWTLLACRVQCPIEAGEARAEGNAVQGYGIVNMVGDEVAAGADDACLAVAPLGAAGRNSCCQVTCIELAGVRHVRGGFSGVEPDGAHSVGGADLDRVREGTRSYKLEGLKPIDADCTGVRDGHIVGRIGDIVTV